MSSLVWCEILSLFVNARTADDNYSVSNMQSLPQIFQTSLSQKKKTFSDFLLHFRNVHKIKCISKKQDEYPRLIISELIDAKRRGYLNV